MSSDSSTGFTPIPGYEDLYSIDRIGRVLSFGHVKGRSGILKPKNVRIIAQERGTGRRKKPTYWRVKLNRYGSHWKVGVHQLVALTYIGQCPYGFVINHKDGNKENNNVDNLEYTTRSYNQKHAYMTGLQSPQRGEDRPMAKLTEENVKFIKISSKKAALLADEFGVSVSLIYSLRSGRRWAHIR